MLEEEPSVTHYKQAFYWFSASFANNLDASARNNVDKGIIEKFDKKPHKIIFEDDANKPLITSSNSKLPEIDLNLSSVNILLIFFEA